VASAEVDVTPAAPLAPVLMAVVIAGSAVTVAPGVVMHGASAVVMSLTTPVPAWWVQKTEACERTADAMTWGVSLILKND
jgi:hypothetical protein